MCVMKRTRKRKLQSFPTELEPLTPYNKFIAKTGLKKERLSNCKKRTRNHHAKDVIFSRKILRSKVNEELYR